MMKKVIMQNNGNRIPWYQKTWAIVLLLIFFFPVGLFLMWRYSRWKIILKVAITALIGIIFMGSVSNDLDNSNNAIFSNKQDTITEDTSLDNQDQKAENIKKEDQAKVDQEQEEVSEKEAKKKAEAEQKATQEAEAAKVAAEQKAAQEAENARIKAEKEKQAQQQAAAQAQQQANQTTQNNAKNGEMVWLSASGHCYHRINNCDNMNPNKARQITKAQAIQQGYTACSKCW